MDINNLDELENTFNLVAENAIKEVGEKALTLLRNYISKDTYGTPHSSFTPEYANGTGEPTYEFLSSFVLDNVQRIGNEVSQELFYDPTSLSMLPHSNGHWGIHSDIHGNDSRENLASYLNTNGFPGISPVERLPFWDDFLNDFNNKYLQWFKEAFQNNGINIDTTGISVSYGT